MVFLYFGNTDGDYDLSTVQSVKMTERLVAFEVDKNYQSVSLLHDVIKNRTSEIRIEGFQLRAPIVASENSHVFVSAIPGHALPRDISDVKASEFLKCHLETLKCKKLFEFNGIVTDVFGSNEDFIFVGVSPGQVDVHWGYNRSNFYYWNGAIVRKLTDFEFAGISAPSVIGERLVFSINLFSAGDKALIEPASDWEYRGVSSTNISELIKKPLGTPLALKRFVRTDMVYDRNVIVTSKPDIYALVSFYSPDGKPTTASIGSGNRIIVWDNSKREYLFSEKMEGFSGKSDIYPLVGDFAGYLSVDISKNQLFIKKFDIFFQNIISPKEILLSSRDVLLLNFVID